MWRPIFYTFAIFINLYVIWFDQYIVELPMPVPELAIIPLKARSMFLTLWCLLLQTAYFMVALLNYFIGTQEHTPKKTPLIRQIKDTAFSLAFPVAIYVSLAFWAVYAFDKEMIFPEHISKFYPVWMNHVMHTTISIFIVIELLTSYRNYPSRKIGFSLAIVFNTSYILWLFVVYALTNYWVYPLLAYLRWVGRIAFVFGSGFVALGFYLIGEKLNRLVCAKPNEMYANGKKIS